MIPQIKEAFTDEILSEAIQRFDINPASITLLGGFESFVYQFKKENDEFILKITHDIRRTPQYIMGEIEWLQHLSSKGLPVLNPISSKNGSFIEEIPVHHGSFLVMVYEKALGSALTEEDWNAELFKAWGSFSGKLHKASIGYQVSAIDYKRQEWTEEEQLKVEKYLPIDDPVISNFRQRMEKLSALKQTSENYGLVHADFHQKNFHYYEGNIYLFDYDDCGYTYFVNDIAISLYYALLYPFKKFENKKEYNREFFRSFMKGYLEHRVIDEEEVALLHDFIKLRHTLIYVIVHQTMNITTFDDDQKAMLKEHQEQILSEANLVNINFAEEYRSLSNEK